MRRPRSGATPDGLPPAANKEIFSRLAKVYKQINAPFGELSMNALKVSTAALKSADANDATYTRLSAQIASWTSQRDGLASEMKSKLNAAAFENVAIDHRSVVLDRSGQRPPEGRGAGGQAAEVM